MKILDEATLVEAIMDTRGQIDFLWQFFVTVHIAIFALIFIYGHAIERLNWPARILSLLGIAGFEWINGNALSKAYLMLDSMHQQYRWAFGDQARFHPDFYREFVRATFADRPDMVLVTHSAALAVVILSFLSQRLLQNRRPTDDPARRLARGYDPNDP